MQIAQDRCLNSLMDGAFMQLTPGTYIVMSVRLLDYCHRHAMKVTWILKEDSAVKI